jgi:hypothetical protein
MLTHSLFMILIVYGDSLQDIGTLISDGSLLAFVTIIFYDSLPLNEVIFYWMARSLCLMQSGYVTRLPNMVLTGIVAHSFALGTLR